VTKIDLATNALSLINSPDFNASEDIAIKPDGTTAYVANDGNNLIVPINLTTFSAGTSIPITTDGFLIAINPSGTKSYVTTASNNVSVVNLVTNSFSSDILGFTGTEGVAFTPNGNKAYVTDNVSSVFPINVQNNSSGSAVAAPFIFPLFVSVFPDQAPTALFTFVAGPSGSQTVFDASTSSSPDGSIQSYAWNFGDGNSLTTTSPTIFHTYASSGLFTVQLTVTNSQGTSLVQTFTGKTVSNNGGPSAQLSQVVNVVNTPIPPAPPTSPIPNEFSCALLKDTFAAHTDWSVRLTWTPSSDPTVVGYKILRDGLLIATIPAQGPFQYNDFGKYNMSSIR